ncbi:uncharacterized protein LOC144646195 isoform X2 [Oculina patagonica]
MARQVAALPKKTFELYRSKKILSSGDHPLFAPGSNQVLANKLGTNSINRTAAICTVQKDLSVPQNQVEVLSFVDTVIDNETKPKTGNKKKRKSKKGKSANASQEHSVTNGTAGEQVANNLDMKHKVLALENCTPLCVSMNTNLVADISTGRELDMVQNSKSSGMDSRSCGSSSPNDSGIVTPDSGLGSYTSPVFTKEPPFGFPPSSQKLLESALGLLPHVALEKDNSSSNADTSKTVKNHLHQSEDSGSDQKEGEQNIPNLQASKTNKNDVPKQEIVEKNCNAHDIEDDPISDISDTKEECKDFVVIEGDSVDGDVSSSSAVEEEGGWQSQTKRSHRKKKKELAARAWREKNHMERFQRKDFHKQQSDNQFRKNHYRRKSVDDKKNIIKTSEKKFQSNENKHSTVLVESSVMNSKMDGQLQAKTDKESESKAGKGPLPSDKKLVSQK